MKKSIIVALLLTSCATIEEMKPCDCVEQYWEYVAPREYQLKDWTEIQCTTPVSIEQAAAAQSPGSNLVTIKCN